jgi:hypothetical protein
MVVDELGMRFSSNIAGVCGGCKGSNVVILDQDGKVYATAIGFNVFLFIFREFNLW